MPSPSIFVSSTFYDLRYIRENLRFFIHSLGYNAVLSEYGGVFYDPQSTAASAAVAEVSNCHLFVLIIGGRYGTKLENSDKSVTNAEYREAVQHKIPVYALVERGTVADYEVWLANRNEHPDPQAIKYPNADDPRIFAFIEEVQAQSANNAIAPFENFGDIQTYLRQQWASLLHSFLTRVGEEDRVAETLGGLERISRRVEILSTQILESVGTKESKLVVELYDRMLGSSAVQNLMTLGLRPSPVDILRHEDFYECAKDLGGLWKVASADQIGSGVTSTHSGSSGEMSESHAKFIRRDYAALREALRDRLDEYGMSVSELADQITRSPEPKTSLPPSHSS